MEQVDAKLSEYLVDVRVVIGGELVHARCSLTKEDIESGKALDWLKEVRELVDKKVAEC